MKDNVHSPDSFVFSCVFLRSIKSLKACTCMSFILHIVARITITHATEWVCVCVYVCSTFCAWLLIKVSFFLFVFSQLVCYSFNCCAWSNGSCSTITNYLLPHDIDKSNNYFTTEYDITVHKCRNMTQNVNMPSSCTMYFVFLAKATILRLQIPKLCVMWNKVHTSSITNWVVKHNLIVVSTWMMIDRSIFVKLRSDASWNHTHIQFI